MCVSHHAGAAAEAVYPRVRRPLGAGKLAPTEAEPLACDLISTPLYHHPR
jgi:hypothetical protein